MTFEIVLLYPTVCMCVCVCVCNHHTIPIPIPIHINTKNNGKNQNKDTKKCKKWKYCTVCDSVKNRKNSGRRQEDPFFFCQQSKTKRNKEKTCITEINIKKT